MKRLHTREMRTRLPAAPPAPPAGIEERWVKLSQGRTRYLAGGAGPALVLAHGLLGYSFSWRFNLPVFAAHATVFAPDLPGCGFSDHTPELDGAMAGTASAFGEFLEAVGISSCDIVASSHGGPVAVMAAAMALRRRHPLVRRMVLCAPANPWSSTRRLLMAALQTSAGIGLFRRLAPHLHFSHGYWLRRLYGDPRRIAPGTLAGYSVPLSCPGGFDRALLALRTWNRDLAEMRSALPEIADIPVLLIWGTLDRAVLPSSSSHLRRALPTAQMAWIEGAGHLPYEECPEQFNAAVTSFLWPEAAPGQAR
jgi:pimeloyl-ACP methyl ester carboxylesterase